MNDNSGATRLERELAASVAMAACEPTILPRQATIMGFLKAAARRHLPYDHPAQFAAAVYGCVELGMGMAESVRAAIAGWKLAYEWPGDANEELLVQEFEEAWRNAVEG